jgi:hypothetical protein
MGRAWCTHGGKRNAYSILVGKPEGKRALGGLDVGGRIMLNGS